MEIIKSNKTQFEYDIQALLKSFYPEWEPHMLAPDSQIRDRRILEGEPVMELNFGESEVTLEMLNGLHNIHYWKPEEEAGTAEYKNAFKRFFYVCLLCFHNIFLIISITRIRVNNMLTRNK